MCALQVLIRAAIDKKAVEDMERCVREICEDLVQWLLHADLPRGLVFHDATQWRMANCYAPETCAVLAHHDESIRNLFKVYSGDIVQTPGQGSSKLMGACTRGSGPRLHM